MFFIFFCFIVIIFASDAFLWKSVTPTIITFVGLLIIPIVHSVVGEKLGFISLNPIVFIYIIPFLLLSFLASIFCRIMQSAVLDINIDSSSAFPLGSTKKKREFRQKVGQYFNSNLVAFSFLIISVALCIFLSFSIFKIFYFGVTEESAELEYLLSRGVIGHSYVLAVAMIPFLYLAFKLSESFVLRYTFATVLVIFFALLFLKQVKYWVIVPFLWLLFVKIYMGFVDLDIRFLFRFIFYIILIFAFFSGVYLITAKISGLVFNDYASFISVMAVHFMSYIFSGILAFSAFVSDGFVFDGTRFDFCSFFTPLCNLVQVAFDAELISRDDGPWGIQIINHVESKTSNVSMLWGELLLRLGWLSFPVFFVLQSVVYFLFCFRYRSLAVLLVCALLMAFLSLSWFSSYFGLLSLYEIPVLLIFISAVITFFARIICTKKVP